MSDGLLIVGGSYAALTIARCAREAGYAEPIRIVSEERHLPYHRPPLSKGLLKGKVEVDSLPLQVEAFYTENNIDLVMGVRVEAVDRGSRSIALVDGRRMAYDWLGLAVGARPRVLPAPGADLEGVRHLRSLDDALGLRAAAASAANVVVVGAGYIGLEVAASLSDPSRRVTVLEIADRPLVRTSTELLTGYLVERHEKAGVHLRMRTGVTEVVGEGGRVRGVKLSDGGYLEADLVVVGAGVVPNLELAKTAGLACDNGIAVDNAARTSDPRIVAAGDCAVFDSKWGGARIRLESVQNAFGQSEVAGATVAGKPGDYDPVPWFWSDQYELKVQSVGLAPGHDGAVLRGDRAGGKFSVYYLKGGRIAAIDSINRPADHMLGRRLLAANASATPEQIADPSFDMKSLLPVAT
jgi:3-phenylpropionate/trans-cinnamate dioxygenase ferredoxin reductase subunit